MPRVKRGTIANKRRKNTLKRAKGFRFGRSTKEREARTALLHAESYAFEHRKLKKRDMRALWNINIGAAAKLEGTSYSKLMGALKKKGILINRKMLSEIAAEHPAVFTEIVKTAL